jgi:glucose-1-phosphate thymidylyltransferase
MKVLILAAGYGTRLYPLIKDTPKPLLEVHRRPLIDYILDTVQDHKPLTEVLVVSNDKFYSYFEAWALEKRKTFPVDITIINDGTKTPEDRLGSIGDIHFVLRQEDIQDDLLVVGGDNLFDFNISEYCQFSQSHGRSVTIGVYDIGKIEEAAKFGVVALDKTGKITSFEEKPKSPKSSLIAMCFYYLPRNSLQLIPAYIEETKKSDKAGDYIKWLCAKQDVYGFQFLGKWYDIGSIESYQEAKKAFK